MYTLNSNLTKVRRLIYALKDVSVFARHFHTAAVATFEFKCMYLASPRGSFINLIKLHKYSPNTTAVISYRADCLIVFLT